jgi:membrane fusion protein (multidrug efflux system)
MAATAVATFGLACGESGARPAATAAAAAPTAVRVVVVHPGTASDRAEAPGVVQAEETAEIRAETDGPIETISFQDGDAVARDQVLVRLRSADARAAVDDADARVRLAKATLDRVQALADRGNASAADLDKAKADRDLAQAALDHAKEALRRTSIRAPFAGVVGKRLVAPREIIDSTRPITRIEAIDRVTLDAPIPERYPPSLAPGSAATATIEAFPGRTFEGTLVYVSPRVSDDTRTVDVRVRLDNADHALRPGMTARASVELGELASAIAVPTQAVVVGAKGSSVWVVGADGAAEQRPIETGPRDAQTVRVTGGLTDGEKVIVEGMIRLKPGVPVNVVAGEDGT